MPMKGEAHREKEIKLFLDNHLLVLLETRRESETHDSKESLQVQRSLS